MATKEKKDTASASRVQVLDFKKSTKGTHVYEEITPGSGEITSQVYIKRSALPSDPPAKICITMDFITE